jgi:X-X-X-Leu-X-X-Gly heptad repeat protein
VIHHLNCATFRPLGAPRMVAHSVLVERDEGLLLVDTGFGTDDLADGIHELAGGAGELSDGLGQATDELPSYTDSERKSLASVVAEPVRTTDTAGIGTGATGPLFAVLALWLGALGMMLVFPPVPFGTRGATRGPLRLALEALALPAGIGATVRTWDCGGLRPAR